MSLADKLPQLLTKADIATRWGMSRQAVHKREQQHENFPKPVMWVHNGSLPLYLTMDVITYEQEKNLGQGSSQDEILLIS